MMCDYVLLTDSSCDLSTQLIEQMDISVLSLSLLIEEKEYTDEIARTRLTLPDFYQRLREGQNAKTSAINVGQFIQAMEPLLKQGKDILYIGFSSGLSSTFSASVSAVEELRQQYPERRIETVDSLCASLGEGMLVYYAAQMRLKGAGLEEVRDFVEQNKLRLCHWFTVDDLHYLKRGGRISPTTALMGSMLNIKPVLHVDNKGHLQNVSKVRGRKSAIKALADHCIQEAENPQEQTMFICHGDCKEDAELLAKMIRAEISPKDIIIDYTGPVIGSHSGPGTLAIFYFGAKRE